MGNYLIGFLLVIIGLIFFMLSWKAVQANPVEKRLQDYVSDSSAPVFHWSEDTGARQQELRGTLTSRVIIPGFRWLGSLFGRLTPKRVMESYDRQLAIANYPMGLKAREFYGIRLIFSLLGYWWVFEFLRTGINLNKLILSALILYMITYLPKIWLRRMVNRRKDKIRKGLPDALDMLSVCAEAGLGFDQSLQRVSEYWRTAIGLEFGRVVKEMEMGVSRQAALRDMSEKLDVDELSSFVAVILQSDQLGMSIAETLSGQAKQMRIERRFRAQEQARKVPLKMLFPMMFFILPALFAVVLGPAIPAIATFFRSMNR
jgi:tight adherence protein C